MNKVDFKQVPDLSCIGKVIRILDQYKLIVNCGKHDLSIGDKVQIYEIGEPIKDLDGTILSNFYFVKDELKVIEVQDSYSICEKPKTIVKKNIANSLVLAPVLEKTVVEQTPLPVDEKDICPLQPTDRKIHIGDKVKLA